jgi:hypothetical protein
MWHAIAHHIPALLFLGILIFVVWKIVTTPDQRGRDRGDNYWRRGD